MVYRKVRFRRLVYGALLALGCAFHAADVFAASFYASVGLGSGLADFDPMAVKTDRLVERVVSLRGSSWIPESRTLGYRPRYTGQSSVRGEFGYRFLESYGLGLEVSREDFQVRGMGRKRNCGPRGSEDVCFGMTRRVSGPDGRGSDAYYRVHYAGRNPGLVVGSVVVNACHTPMRLAEEKIGLYACLRAGVGTVDAWGVRGGLRPLLGGKVGAEMMLAGGVYLFGEAYYHTAGEISGRARVEKVVDGKRRSVPTSLGEVSYLGTTVGVRIEY